MTRIRRPRPLLAALGLAAMAATTAGLATSAAAAPTHHPDPGPLVSASQVGDLSAADVTSALAADGFDTSRVASGVDAWRVTYRTERSDGSPTLATGLLVLPENGDTHLRAVAYDHGTMAGRNEAPSAEPGGRSDEGMEIGSAGYAAIEPDYIGLGEGPGPHPYLQLSSEVTATTDMVRAAFELPPRLQVHLDPRLLITGFSQGGPAAMAYAKSLQHGPGPFRAADVAPISGPYDLAGAELPAVLDGQLDAADSTYYVSYLLTSWNRLYHLYGAPAAVLQAPYDTTVPPLFDGSHDEDTIFPALPPTVEQLLTPAGLDLLRHPTPTFRAALAANDASCQGWRPGTPIHLFAAHADEQVAVQNTLNCRSQLTAAGVPSDFTDVGDYGHLDSGRHGLAGAVSWFQQVAPPRG